MMKRFISYEGKMIYSTLKQLIAKKEIEERRKISYRTISDETGISTGTLVRLCDFRGINKIEAKTLNTLCRYFNCNVGDILKFFDDPEEKGEKDLMKLASAEYPEDFPYPDETTTDNVTSRSDNTPR